jgi:hypothetical protein
MFLNDKRKIEFASELWFNEQLKSTEKIKLSLCNNTNDLQNFSDVHQ